MKRKSFSLRNVWIINSAPATMSLDTVDEFRKKLSENFNVSYWDRRVSYDQKSFNEADVLVILLPGLKFKSSYVNIPFDIQLVIKEARRRCKDIYLGYKAGTGYHIYNCDIIENSHITGITGTADALILAEKRSHMGSDSHDMYYNNEVKHNDYNYAWGKSKNPCAEIKLPGKKEESTKTKLPRLDSNDFDERLLLLL